MAEAQNFFTALSGAPATLPGNRCSVPGLLSVRDATRVTAWALSGRCSVRFCFVSWDGLRQTPRCRSKSAFLAPRISPICARKELERNGIGSSLIGVRIKNVAEALELVILQPSIALFLLVALDPIN